MLSLDNGRKSRRSLLRLAPFPTAFMRPFSLPCAPRFHLSAALFSAPDRPTLLNQKFIAFCFCAIICIFLPDCQPFSVKLATKNARQPVCCAGTPFPSPLKQGISCIIIIWYLSQIVNYKYLLDKAVSFCIM